MRWNRIWQTKKTWGKGGDGTQIESTKQELISKEYVQGAEISTFSGNTEIRSRRITGVNFAGAQLCSLRLFDVTFVECSFDNANLRDLRMWSTEIQRCSFRKADLRGSSLGGLLEGRRNRFVDVDFEETDMRQTAWTSASFDRCIFRNANLAGVNLQGSTFSHCVFEGELQDVIFNRYAYKREDLPANEMGDVDFSRAKLRFVGFRNLRLDGVRFPEDTEHLVFEDYRNALERALVHLQEDNDSVAKKLNFFLSNELKWTIAGEQGLLNIKDLVAVAGDTAPQRLLAALT